MKYNVSVLSFFSFLSGFLLRSQIERRVGLTRLMAQTMRSGTRKYFLKVTLILHNISGLSATPEVLSDPPGDQNHFRDVTYQLKLLPLFFQQRKS
jgi:hypothetical protein